MFAPRFTHHTPQHAPHTPHTQDASQDHRFTKTYLADARVAVFGVGDSSYEGNYALVAKQMMTRLFALGAGALVPLGIPY